MTQKTPSQAWHDAKTAAEKYEKHGIMLQLTSIANDGRIPPDDADPELKELFVETMEALGDAASTG